MRKDKLFSGLLAGTMALSAVIPAMAVTTTDSVIDPAKTGKLTIHKLIDNQGNNQEADGLVNPTENRLPVKDVEFSYAKIADLVNVSGATTDGGETAVGFYYKPLANFTDFETALGVTIEKTTIGGETYYTTEAVEAAMRSVLTSETEMAVSQFVNAQADASAAGSGHIWTDANGTASKDTMDLGLYLIAETDISYHDGAAGNTQAGTAGYYGKNVALDAGKYVVSSIDAHGQTTTHSYNEGDFYRESTNPEAPVVETAAAPFLVSLPTTNTAVVDGNAPGTVWQYDVDVYPKNQTTQIVKRIVDPDEADGVETLRTSEDFQIGDRIEQVIWADAPILQPNYLNEKDSVNNPGVEDDAETGTAKNKHTKYVISDTMTEGLTVDKVTKVAFGNRVVEAGASGNNNVAGSSYNSYIALKANEFNGFTAFAEEDYTVTYAPDKHSFQVELTSTGLAKLDAATTDQQVIVYFDSTMNSNAKIGEVAQNMNYPTLTWKNTNTAERSINGNEVYDYTYQLNIKKEGVKDATNVKFIVDRTDANDVNAATEKNLGDPAVTSNTSKIPSITFDLTLADGDVWFVEEAPGVYHVWDNTYAIAANDAEGAPETTVINGGTYHTLTPAADGTLIIKGFDSDKYTFKEVQTEDESNLLRSTFTVDIAAADSADIVDMRDGKVKTATVQTSDDAAPVAITIGVDDVNMPDAGKNAGIMSMIVNNYDAIDLRTGGAGRMAIYSVGVAMIGVMGIGLIVYKKKKEEA